MTGVYSFISPKYRLQKKGSGTKMNLSGGVSENWTFVSGLGKRDQSWRGILKHNLLQSWQLNYVNIVQGDNLEMWIRPSIGHRGMPACKGAVIWIGWGSQQTVIRKYGSKAGRYRGRSQGVTKISTMKSHNFYTCFVVREGLGRRFNLVFFSVEFWMTLLVIIMWYFSLESRQ